MFKLTDNLQKIIDDFYSTDKVISYYSKPRLHLYERNLFKNYLKKKGKVLDLCCGAGRVAIPLAKMGFDVIGVDINPKMIDAANKIKKKYNIKNVKFICGDAPLIKIKENYFDYVLIMENSLEYIVYKNRREKIIKKIFNALKNDGIFITCFSSYFYPLNRLVKLTFHNIDYLAKSLIYDKQELGINDILLIYRKFNKLLFSHFFTHFEIKGMMKKAGFKSFKTIPFNNLDKRKNKFRNPKLYDFLFPFIVQFWIIKK